MKHLLTLGLGLSLLLALILRVPDLDQRPFHNDEAVNAIKARALLEQGTYRYDPHEFHGPTLHYATWLLARATAWPSFAQTTEAHFRWLTVLFGTALIPLLWMVRDALGRRGTAWAAVLTALSPVLVFFSRDYIHEMLLVTFTSLLIGCLWRYMRNPSWKWAVAAGGAVGLMQATKETFVFTLAAMGLAYGLVRLWSGPALPADHDSPRRRLAHGSLMLGAWLLVALTLFSSLGQNPAGPLDAARTYVPWLSRAGGESPHIHPWWFYGERLFWQRSGSALPWTELGLVAAAFVAVRAAFIERGLGEASPVFVRWLAFYSGILFIIYSVIPYKTPWCVLGVAHGLVLLAGVGMAVLWRRAWKLPQRAVLAGATLLLLAQLCGQAWALSHSRVSTRENPWAYADTVPDVGNLVGLVDCLAAVSPRHADMNIQVVCAEDDYWPLPYSLRRYHRVGWWGELPPLPYAPVVITSSRFSAAFEENADYWNAGAFQLRRGVFVSCYVQKPLWESFLAARSSD